MPSTHPRAEGVEASAWVLASGCAPMPAKRPRWSRPQAGIRGHPTGTARRLEALPPGCVGPGRRRALQGNHIHLLVEAPDRDALAQAMKGLSVRFAKGFNRMMGRSGQVFADRFHSRVLATPSEVRRAMDYIRNNARKHAAQWGDHYPSSYVDPFSSDAQDIALPTATTWLV